MISKSKLLRGAWAAVAVVGLAVGANAFSGTAYAHDDDERADADDDAADRDHADQRQQLRSAPTAQIAPRDR